MVALPRTSSMLLQWVWSVNLPKERVTINKWAREDINIYNKRTESSIKKQQMNHTYTQRHKHIHKLLWGKEGELSKKRPIATCVISGNTA